MSKEKHLVSAINDLGLVHSRSQARRVIVQGGVQVHGKIIFTIDALVETDDLIQVGKKRAAKVD